MNRLSALFKQKCPNCYAGDIYKKRTYLGFGKIHDRCSHCDHKYDKEPGFFFGAMYVSYALTVAEGVGTFIICQFFFESFLSIWMVPILLGVILLLAGFNYTFSRIIWMYLFTGKGTSKSAANSAKVVS